ncbi:MAG: hypothetical protein ACE5NA_08425 [Nitrospiraceae bacterium]
MNDGTQERVGSDRKWMRIPDGTKVRHRLEGYEGAIDGLTEIVAQGSSLNPDGRTQYRVDVGDPQLKRASEDDLLLVADGDGVMLTGKKQSVEYRREITKRLRSWFADDKFVV